MAPFCAVVRGRIVEPVRVRRRRMISNRSSCSTRAPTLRRDFHQPAIERQAFQVALEIGCADQVDHDVDAATSRERRDALGEIFGAVVDGSGRAESHARGALFVVARGGIGLAAEFAASWMAVTPMPLLPPCTSTDSPATNRPWTNRLAHTVK